MGKQHGSGSDESRNYHDGVSDGLEPVSAMDVVGAGTVSDLLNEYAHTSFGGRTLGEGANTLEHMLRDPDCFVVMTLSGAMTVAKMGMVICDMIDRGWVQAVVSTGALMAHGLVEGTGRTHFKYDPRMNDEELFEKGYDRVYDTLELEQNLDDVELIVRRVITDLPDDREMSSHQLMRAIGKHLDDTLPPNARGVLRSAYRKAVPVYVPAFTDSELGLDWEVSNQVRLRDGKSRRVFDPFGDLAHYARLLAAQEAKGKCFGIFTIGGGVPRNWAQQAGPLFDLLARRIGADTHHFRFKYGLRICPEPVYWGGLSGCTYSEGVSWGKFVPRSEGGVFSEILSDATIAWPLLVRGVLERVGNEPLQKAFEEIPDDASLIPSSTAGT